MAQRTATIVVTDLVGSTELRVRLGEERAESLRRVHDTLLRVAVESHAGCIVKGLGDGVLASFDGAADAVAATVAIQQALARHNRAHPSEALVVRTGISAGDVTVEDDDVFGTPVVEASRLCAVAEGGQVLANDLVTLLARGRGGHSFASVGSLELKGLPEPVPTSEVIWSDHGGSDVPLPPILRAEERFPFAGRHDAVLALRRAWKEADRGTRVVLVAGEPGIGKTRLVREVSQDVAGDGAVVLWGRCDDSLAIPYQPFTDALSWWVDACPPDRLDLGPLAGELVRLLPDLGARVPNLEPPLDADPDIEQRRLFAAVTDVVARLGRDAPAFVVLDDLHWAARPTLLLLRHLVRSDSARALVVCTYRDTDLGRGHPLADVLGDLRREANVERIALRGLDAGEVLALMEGRAGHELPPEGIALADALHGETEGNPFFVGELLAHLAESGAIVRSASGWVAGAADATLPEGIRQVVGQRLSRLPDSTNALLGAAAVLGLEFDLRTLAGTAGVTPAEALDALAPAEEAHIVSAVPGKPGRYGFAHALVRSTLAEELPTTRRLQLHAAAARTLSDRGDDAVEELAFHACEAAVLGDVTGAVTVARRAAQRARDRLAWDDAVVHLERAEAAASLGGLDRNDALDLRLDLGECMHLAGDARHREILLRVGRDAETAGDVERLIRAASALVMVMYGGELGFADAEVVALADAAMLVAPPRSSERARLLADLGELLQQTEDGVRGRELLREGAETAEATGDEALAVRILAMRDIAVDPYELPAVRRRRAEQLLGRAEAIGDLQARWAVLVARSLAEFDEGDLTAVRASQEQMTDVATALGLAGNEWTLLTGILMRRGVTAPPAEVLPLLERLSALATRAGMPESRKSGVEVAIREALLGAVDPHRDNEALREMAKSQPGMGTTWWAAEAARAIRVDRLGDAREIVTREVERLDELPRDFLFVTSLHLLGLAVGRLGDAERAVPLYELLEPFAGRLTNAGVTSQGFVDHSLALLAHALGRADETDRWFDALEEHNERAGIGWPAVDALIDRARVSDERGDLAAARDGRERALVKATELGLHGRVADLQAQLAIGIEAPVVPGTGASGT